MSARGGGDGGGGNKNDDEPARRTFTQEQFDAAVAVFQEQERLKREHLRLEREIEEVKQRNEQRKRELEELKQRNEQRKREYEIERERDREFEEGAFYANIDQVWGTTTGAQTRSLVGKMQELCRDNCPTFLARGANPNEPGTAAYVVTRDCALLPGEAAADDPTESRSTIRRNEETRIWPTDSFGNTESGDAVHLVPATTLHASLYTDVGRCALGVHGNADWDTLQMMIHGSRGENGLLPHTGMKHFVSNKIRLDNQGRYLEGAPGVVVVPIMTLDEMKNWNGEGYDAVVMVGASEEYYIIVKGVCKGIRMGKPPDSNRVEPGHNPIPFDVRYCIADRGQVERARQLLEHVLLGLADSLVNNLTKDPVIKEKLTAEQQAVLNELGDERLFAEQLFLPEAKDGTFRVRLVRFEAHIPPPDIPPNLPANTPPYAKHPAPDPLLLAIRAAMTWSWRHGQKLLAATVPQDEDDELSVLAYEQYLEDYADAIRPKTQEDLARGLGQEGGYKEE